MSENNVSFLGEEDFLPVMENENRIWREKNVENAGFVNRDGIRLNYYRAEAPDAKAAVVIVHGYCEFWGKYHEYAWYLWQAGFTVYFLEQRCHGYSGGKLPEPDMIHIDSFRTYAEDLHEFMDQVVKPKEKDLPLLMLAHSMGGAIGALFLESWPEYFRGAVLTSPMLQISTGGMAPWKIALVKLYMILAHKQKDLCPGQHHFDPTPKFATSSTLSEVRYNYLFHQRINDIHYRTAGATFGWVMAAIAVKKMILRHADRIRIPITLMQAGMDTLVEPQGFDDFMAKVPQAQKFFYAESKHEIFNAGDDVRYPYFSNVLNRLASMAGQEGNRNT
jgi:lysophospholipase